jgi:peptidoglycan/LPS O-acetylase OafA/YrhL
MLATLKHSIDSAFPLENINKLYAAFSVYTQGQKLFDVTRVTSANSIDCLHGIRALSVLYIIYGHRYGISISNLMDRQKFDEWYSNPMSAFFNTHQVAVDTFLFMGGLLLVWSMLPKLDR